MPGEAVVTLSALEGNEILGYLPENLPIQPSVGTSVRVRAEGYGALHWEGDGTIKQLSGVWMPATNTLSAMADTPIALGLPVVVELPIGVKLAPGRSVHLTLLP